MFLNKLLVTHILHLIFWQVRQIDEDGIEVFTTQICFIIELGMRYCNTFKNINCDGPILLPSENPIYL